MSLKTTVKVSHLSNLSDARYCAGMGVGMLGFRVIPGRDHYIPQNVFQDIRGWIAGPAIVVELYGVTSAEQINEVVKAYAPDYVEMTTDEYLKFGDRVSLPCIVECAPAADLLRLPDNSNISFALVGQQTSCSDLPATKTPVLVQIDSPNLLGEKLDAGCFHGVVLAAPHEQRPGITGYEHLGEILESLEEE